MFQVTDTLGIDEGEWEWSFARAGGPGGQNVNKVASKATLRWRLTENTSLPADVKARLVQQQRRRVTQEGELIIVSQRFRDQDKNRTDCLEKLREMIVQALVVPIPRKASKPSKASKRRRVEDKRRRSTTKAGRRKPDGE